MPYAYDADDRLKQTFYGGVFIDDRLYDAAGRAVLEGSNGAYPTNWVSKLNGGVNDPDADVPTNQLDKSTRINKYDEHGQLVAQRVMKGTTTVIRAEWAKGKT